MTAVPLPLADITNSKVLQANKQPLSIESAAFSKCSLAPIAEFHVPAAAPTVQRFAHDPYNWKCIPDESQIAMIMNQRSAVESQQRQIRRAPVAAAPAPEHAKAVAPSVASSASPTSCKALVQFKCHQTEFASPLIVDKGQYVVVQGDRGIDIGVVIRVNTDATKAYVERTGPNGSIIRHATQREVDYWATDLKADEATALDYCQERVTKLRLPMEVKHAEYQFDKKKLTFYYEAKSRVDFVTMLKELYREFGCRIWMEKVRLNQME